MFFHSDGLFEALDEFNDSVQNRKLLPDAYYDSLVEMICAKQLHSGELRGTFDPGQKRLREGIFLYTGERVRTKLATRSIVSLEAGRALAVAESLNASARSALANLNTWLENQCFHDFCGSGECRYSTIAFLRYSASGAMKMGRGEIDSIIESLKTYRDGKGRWNGFPFYYTLLTLSELDTPAAGVELEYARPACERALKLTDATDLFSSRRKAILQKLLQRPAANPDFQLTLRDLWVV
ncbi:MAG: hypothetical protein ACFFAY_16145 [Promethearchaeota archaeon]